MAIFTLGHVTDVHLGPIRGLTPRYWNLKRAMGFANWQHSRVDAHQREIADRLIADLITQAPDHIAVTGDLTNLGLPLEHAHALDWLGTVGPAHHVSVIPGNHDIYSALHGDPGFARWRAHMTGNDTGDDATPTSAPETIQFPYVRRLGRVALVGLNSAVPTPPMVASGELGETQRHQFAGTIKALHDQGFFTVVMIHHPPLVGQARPARGLRDAAALERIFETHGAGLVIHGHNHRNMLAWRTGPLGPFPVIGAPSLSLAKAHKTEALARYNLYRIEATQTLPRIELIGRGLAQPGGPIVELERRVLVAPAVQPVTPT
jgi:3',5'-cyclic AMP phosphodiesterase CpdA